MAFGAVALVDIMQGPGDAQQVANFLRDADLSLSASFDAVFDNDLILTFLMLLLFTSHNY